MSDLKNIRRDSPFSDEPKQGLDLSTHENSQYQISRCIPHSVEKVWPYLTISEKLSEWLFPNDFIAEIGGEFQFWTPPGDDCDGVLQGKVVDIQPNERISYTLASENCVDQSLLEWTLDEATKGSRITLSQSGPKIVLDRFYEILTPEDKSIEPCVLADTFIDAVENLVVKDPYSASSIVQWAISVSPEKADRIIEGARRASGGIFLKLIAHSILILIGATIARQEEAEAATENNATNINSANETVDKKTGQDEVKPHNVFFKAAMWLIGIVLSQNFLNDADASAIPEFNEDEGDTPEPQSTSNEQNDFIPLTEREILISSAELEAGFDFKMEYLYGLDNQYDLEILKLSEVIPISVTPFDLTERDGNQKRLDDSAGGEFSNWLTSYSGIETEYGYVDYIFVGTIGDDFLEGTTGNDLIKGGSGNDQLNGNAGNDILLGGSGDDTLDGGDGDDTLFGGLGRDFIFGGWGQDWLWGGKGWDTLQGGEGDDWIFGELGKDVIHGNAGDDILNGGQGDDSMNGDEGDDNIFGGLGEDTIAGGLGDDQIFGEAGDDAIGGESGNDGIFGGDGNDRITGGSGDDQIFGDGGDDIINGGSGNDTLEGGDGRDDINGGSGDDIIEGGDGSDFVAGDAGNDHISGGGGFDILYGCKGNDVIDGGDNTDLLVGADGHDVLNGGNGRDYLYGGSGNDVLEGGTGNDTLVGNSGADRFVFSGQFDSDTIFGFEATDSLHFDSFSILFIGYKNGNTIIDVHNSEGQDMGSVLLNEIGETFWEGYDDLSLDEPEIDTIIQFGPENTDVF
jgi:Ca2+-binding RTX toxin-like protein/uncharacterized protein YndB with AHSA1/START domain